MELGAFNTFDSRSVFWRKGKVNFVIPFGLESCIALFMSHKIRLLPLNDLTLDHVLIFFGRIDLFFYMAASDLLSNYSRARSSAGDRSIIGNLLLQKGNQSNPVHSYGNLSLRNPALKILFSSMISCPSTPFIQTSKQIHLSSL